MAHMPTEPDKQVQVVSDKARLLRQALNFVKTAFGGEGQHVMKIYHGTFEDNRSWGFSKIN